MSSPLSNLADVLMEGVKSKDRTYHLQTFKNCFVASEAVDFMVSQEGGLAADREEAVELGKAMVEEGLIFHVTKDNDFKDANLFFRFKALEKSHGEAEPGSTWATLARADSGRDYLESKQVGFTDEHASEEVSPLDDHNIRLLDNVKPRDWKDPQAEGVYNCVCIGGGAGGLITSVSLAGLGGKVALIERHLLGGDCLNVGCVPSKALIRAARAVKEIRNGGEFGITYDNLQIDFGKIMSRLREKRADISPADSAARYAGFGVDVFQGSAKFISKDTIEVNGQKLKFAKACIATGARARIPDIPGILDVPYLTNATIFNLTELPAVFGVIGGGPIGCELAQAFARFGSRVILFDISDKVLPREDPDASEIVQGAMSEDGVEFRFKSSFKQLKTNDEGQTIITFSSDGGPEETIVLDKLLISAGRTPNIENLGLDKAGVDTTSRGLVVNDYLQTTNKNIYGVGDVALPIQLTHLADSSARMVVKNMAFFGKEKFSKLVIPWCTYTSPEVAHVGKYERELEKENTPYDIYSLPFKDNDRAILEGHTDGFVKIITKKGKDTILGATIVGEHAGDLISEVTLAITQNVGLGSIASVIHPYPTEADAIRRCGDFYNKTRLNPTNKAILRNLLKFRR